jgi:hypothetical protein
MTEADTTNDVQAAGHREKPIEVTVTFPLAQGQPFHERATPTETVGEIRGKAISHFEIVAESGSTYFLTHDGSRVDDAKTLAELDGKAGAVKFTLVKELIQGQS